MLYTFFIDLDYGDPIVFIHHVDRKNYNGMLEGCVKTCNCMVKVRKPIHASVPEIIVSLFEKFKRIRCYLRKKTFSRNYGILRYISLL